ncbi:hypothetical protein DRN44_01840 [Thermococci archaeon]|nr:MAG: hypothetical protein DRN44_01840 [Thermococci archaeon]
MERKVRQDLLERRSEISQLIISVILLGIAVGILSNAIFTRVEGSAAGSPRAPNKNKAGSNLNKTFIFK